MPTAITTKCADKCNESSASEIPRSHQTNCRDSGTVPLLWLFSVMIDRLGLSHMIRDWVSASNSDGQDSQVSYLGAAVPIAAIDYI